MDRSSDTAPGNESNKKRVSSEEDEDFQHKSKRNCPLGSEDEFAAKNEDSDEENLAKFEALARHFVSKGAEKKLLPVLSSYFPQMREQHESGKEVSSEMIGSGSEAPKYVLCFYNQIASVMYANKEIKSVTGETLKIAIFNSANLNIPVSTCKLSSAPVELFLEDGEHKEISKSDNGKFLMFGDLQLNLQNGIGEVNHLTVTDSSYRFKLKKFYLGVRITDKKILSNFCVNEKAISQAFRVFSERMQGKEKHHPPKWDDGLHRLEGVGDKYKNILSSLQPHPINTVGDFLVAHDYGRGAMGLKQILGIKGADNKWDKIIKHAMECDDPRASTYVQHFRQANDGNYWKENFGVDEHDEQNQSVNDQNLEFSQQNRNQNQIQNDEFREDLGRVLTF